MKFIYIIPSLSLFSDSLRCCSSILLCFLLLTVLSTDTGGVKDGSKSGPNVK